MASNIQIPLLPLEWSVLIVLISILVIYSLVAPALTIKYHNIIT